MMSFLKRQDQPRVCPKTGKIIQSNRNFRWQWWLLPFTGLAAMIWFLVRVIPKPSRAAYPCQRLAFPIATGFITWVIGIAASTIAFHKAKRHLAKARYVLAAICIAISVASIYVALSYTSQDKTLAAQMRIAQPVNSPIGVAKGVHPGRVAWIWDPNATNWLGSTDIQGINDGYWWEPNHTSQAVVTEMFSKSLRALTDKSSDYAAWDSIFRYFNQQHGKGNVGYQAGEKIMIKVNFVGLITSATGTGASSYNFKDNYPNTSPQAIFALLDQLVNIVGVNDADITIGDTVTTFTNTYFSYLDPCFPDVNYIDAQGLLGRGKTANPSTNPRVYWADPNSNSATNKDYVPNAFKNASYVINFANLKGHYNQAGITACGKNHYGSLNRTPSYISGYYDLHLKQMASVPGMGHYRALVDLMGHPHLGGKTVLYLIDGLYPNKHSQNWLHDFPFKWQQTPFNNDWASSFFASQDPLAIDSVAFDFIYNEWPTEWPGYDGADDYMHEAALAPASPSGYTYAPAGDGNVLTSQGVHEHWNNTTNKQYTRNLDPVNGTGIELVNSAPGWTDLNFDGWVDFGDFAILANAWRSHSGDTNWDANCDISSTPGDGVIDEKDLYVLAENWLADLTKVLVKPGASIQQVYGTTGIFYEGATWDTNSNKFFFTKRTSGYQILRLESPGNATVWMDSAPATNGMILGLNGRLLTCDENLKQIRSHIIGSSGPQDTQVLGTAPDMPNDLCELTNGNIYFTCPTWSGSTYQGVYILRPGGSITRVNNTLIQPNGIITSLDETKLYVAESSSSDNTKKRWWVFPINSDGTLGTGSVFFKPTDMTSMRYTDPDGMTIDERGNLYFTGLGGVWAVSPTGQELKRIWIPQQPSNICFGGPDGKTLYITCQDKVYTLAMVVRGGE
jgi:sugar lactone lactonase YvrE